jgi:hypothetical protein
MITATVLFFLASLIALDVARRHEIGRKSVTPPNPWPTLLRPQRPPRHLHRICGRDSLRSGPSTLRNRLDRQGAIRQR